MTDDILPRHLMSELREALSYTRIVNLVGPRQVGKTTLVRDLLDSGRFITLDNEGTRAAIDEDAFGLILALREELGDAPLIIDEAQRSKDLSLAIKRIVDQDRRKGQFVLTGSSNVFRTTNVADSLAGRMLSLKLWPLSAAEIHRAPYCQLIDWATQDTPQLAQIKVPRISRAEVIDLILRGGFPEIRTLDLRNRQRQYRDNVDSLVDRDVADIVKIRKTDALRRLIDQMAARTAQELNIAEVSNGLQIRRETVEQYLDVLLRLSVILKLGAWTSGEGKREIKNPKYHFVDSGTVCALRHINERLFDIDGVPGAIGPVLESYVVNELVRSAPMQQNAARFYHWRSPDKREIDVLVESGKNLIGVEVKAAATVNSDSPRHLRWFTKDGPGRTRQFTGLIFYLGEEKLSFGDRIFALPISSLWAEIKF
ncbi:ATP-binding protein [Pelagibius litoralis]|uniref:ATP-binding protein n=1 Tax=Pelagibius litoralis TaxID=374515 RepID=A0A967KEY5_9PROT|nr:ATP-binding protein [Pelagibius litoralis]NIA70995.1 ATP-binding protein [Pelagibius litoralis]